MKIFGLNILTDKALDKKINNANFDKILKFLKIKKLYKITYKVKYIPKCCLCDEDRQLNITLPDGTIKKIDCSCNKSYFEYSYFEVNPNNYYAIFQRLDKKIWVTDDPREGFWRWEKAYVDNLEDPDTSSFYTTISKVKKAVDILNKREKDNLLKKE